MEQMDDEIMLMVKDARRRAEDMAHCLRDLERKLEKRLGGIESSTKLYERVFSAVFVYSEGMMLQSAVYHAIEEKVNAWPEMGDICRRNGWTGTPQSPFWRGFWRWLASQEGITRKDSPRPSRFVGLSLGGLTTPPMGYFSDIEI